MVTFAYLALSALAVFLSATAPFWMALIAGVAALAVLFRHELWLPSVPQFKG